MNDIAGAYNITLFQFGCCLCGAKQHPENLRSYLGAWQDSGPRRLSRLLSAFSGVINELGIGKQNWINEETLIGLNVLEEIITRMSKQAPFSIIDDITTRKDKDHIGFLADCPVCEIPAGRRMETKYFKPWTEAGRSQVGGFLWEVNLIFWSVCQLFPDWLSGEAAENMKLLRNGSKYTALKSGLFECPQCGRFASSLFGGPSAGKDQFCRWCLNDGMPYLEDTKFKNGIGMGFAIELKPDGPELHTLEPEPEKPAEQDRDMLPPEEEVY
jgi:hypothetical protein